MNSIFIYPQGLREKRIGDYYFEPLISQESPGEFSNSTPSQIKKKTLDKWRHSITGKRHQVKKTKAKKTKYWRDTK